MTRVLISLCNMTVSQKGWLLYRLERKRDREITVVDSISESKQLEIDGHVIYHPGAYLY